jgi:hypothetical protein
LSNARVDKFQTFARLTNSGATVDQQKKRHRHAPGLTHALAAEKDYRTAVEPTQKISSAQLARDHAELTSPCALATLQTTSEREDTEEDRKTKKTVSA